MGNARIRELSFKTEEKWHSVPCTGGVRKSLPGDAVELELSLPSPSLVNEVMTRLAAGRAVDSCILTERPEGTDDLESVRLGPMTVENVEELQEPTAAGAAGMSGFVVRLVLQPSPSGGTPA